jgi:hypothetical protein
LGCDAKERKSAPTFAKRNCAYLHLVFSISKLHSLTFESQFHDGFELARLAFLMKALRAW